MLKTLQRNTFVISADRELATSSSHKSMQALMQERDSTLEDMKAVEDAFTNLHQRYEKTKQVLMDHKKVCISILVHLKYLVTLAHV